MYLLYIVPVDINVMLLQMNFLGCKFAQGQRSSTSRMLHALMVPYHLLMMSVLLQTCSFPLKSPLMTGVSVGSSLSFLEDFQNHFKSLLPLLNIVWWVARLITHVNVCLNTHVLSRCRQRMTQHTLNAITVCISTWKHIYMPSSFCALGSLSHIDKIF